MSTELSTITQAEIDELAKLSGADPTLNSQERTPTLKVNYNAEDAQENRLPLGQWFVTDQEVPVYAKTVRIRPLQMHYQYTHYDSDEEKFINQTVFNTSFYEDFLDEKGGVRCGRPDSKTLKDMTDDRKAMYKDISCTRRISCLVSYTGEDKDGNEHTVENMPVVLNLRGANFMAFDDQFYKKLPRGRKMWDFWTELSLTKEKKGSVTYYVIGYTTDMNVPVALDRDVVDTIRHFSTLTSQQNDAIIKKHKASMSGKSSEDFDEGFIPDGADLEGDFDEIPF